MTVKEAVQQHLDHHFSMSWADSEAFLELIIPGMQRTYQEIVVRARSGLVDSEAVEKLEKLAQEAKMAAECWDKDVEQYSTECWKSLTKTVEDLALGWAIARLNTLEATLQKFHQEIHRLSSPLNEQGKAE